MTKINFQNIWIKNLKVIFFDVGDTLYSSEEMEEEYPRQIERLLAKDRGISIQEAKRIIDEQGKKLKGKIPHVTKVAIMESLGYSRTQVHEAFNKVDPSRFLHKDEKLQQTLKGLKLRYKLGIITNFQKKHTEQILSVLGVPIEDFEYFVGEEDVKEIKPSLEPFITALNRTGVNASQTAYVADSITKDLQPAKQVGMHTIWVGGVPEKIPDEHKPFVDCAAENIYQVGKILSK